MPFDPLNPPLARPGDHLRWGALPAGALDELIAQAKALDMDQVKAEIAAEAAGGGHVHGPGCNH